MRVLAVIPATELPSDAAVPAEAGAAMIFAHRQVASLREAGVTIETFFLNSRTSPALLVQERRRLSRAIRQFRPDLIHAHYGTMTAFCCAVSTRLPLVITYRGSDLNPAVGCISWLRSAAGRLLSQVAALRARRIICVSDELKRRLLWAKGRAMVIPSGVDTRIFHPRGIGAARAKLAWSAHEYVVLFNAGQFPKFKRLDVAQAAVGAARKICGPIRFEVLDGYQQPETVSTMLNAADCLLVTSDWEGSPNIVKEALACNLPVVSVDVGDVRERLATVRPSRIVDRNPEHIGKALAEVLVQRDRSNGFLAIQALSHDRIALAIRRVYQDALER